MQSAEDINLILVKIYSKKGEYKKAYDFYNKHSEQYKKGSVEKFKTGLGVALSKRKFENQKKVLIQEQNKAITKQKNYVYLAVLALIMVSLFLIMFFITNRLQ